MPDGAIFFEEETRKKLKMKFQINDLRMSEYHRNNGFTKLSIRIPTNLGAELSSLVDGNSTAATAENPEDSGQNALTKLSAKINAKLKSKIGGGENITWPTLVITDALVNLIDLTSRNIIHHLNNKIYTMGTTMYMGSLLTEEMFMSAVINVICFAAFPIALSLLLPVFMFTTVLEKEERIHTFMLMHGLNNINYWAVNFTFNMMLYTLSTGVFYIIGTWVCEMPLFVKTGFIPMWVILLGWGLNQVCFSVFIQNFIATSRTATIAGYILA
jgi:hypothetical protein